MTDKNQYTIVNRWTGAVIVTGEYDSIKALLADNVDANLSGANLRGADLSGANLCGADLRGANLSNADLSNADLSDANLRGANLYNADLRGANLSNADLSGTDLCGANLSGANLRGANLDYSAWPLQCSSTKAIVDDRIKAQLMYHALCLVGDAVEIPQAMKDFVNSNFHRVGELPKL